MEFPTSMFLILFILLIIVVPAFVILLLCLKFRAVKLARSRPPTFQASYFPGLLLSRPPVCNSASQ